MSATGDESANADATRLYLIRHGEAQVMLDRVIGGEKGCTGLTDRGRRQVEALRDRLAATGEIEADVLYASVLARAIETAEILAPALGGLEVLRDCEVCELHPGDGDAMTWDDWNAEYGGWDPTNDPYQPVAPGGESWAEFGFRVGRALHRLVAQHAGQSIVVACHGGVIDGSLVNFLGLPVQQARGFDLTTTNASITEWERRVVDGRPRWRLARYNDAAHLAGLP